MGIKRIFGLIVLLISINVSFCQVKLYPQVGIAFVNNRLIGTSNLLKTHQMESSQYFGLSIEKKFERHSLGINFIISDVKLQAKYFPDYQYGRSRRISGTGTTQNIIGVNYCYDWFKVNLIQSNKKIYGTMPLVDEYNELNENYLLNFKFQPIFGISLVKVVDTNWDGYRFDTTLTNNQNSSGGVALGIGLNDGWDLGNVEGSNKIVNNEWGASFQFGFRTQFYKNDKDRFVIGFLYNQGLATLLKTTYTADIAQNKGTSNKTETALYGGRGSFFSIYLSYPITILNKKGERFRDRHSKL